jgi:AmmeMemoRadiSam system protein B
MSPTMDEEEHSIEMHLPYIAKVMESRKGQFTVVPVLVGALKEGKEELYGRIFSRYLADPHNLFVVSSDFCHWGGRFHYTHYNKKNGPIHSHIERLDHDGMERIESLDPKAFSAYLQETRNTICGRHPIAVLLNAVSELQSSDRRLDCKLKFVSYSQSNECKSQSDSSVSYASASLIISSSN